MLDVGKLDPPMFPGPSPLVLRDREHLPSACYTYTIEVVKVIKFRSIPAIKMAVVF
jgi:hypothetical protein